MLLLNIAVSFFPMVLRYKYLYIHESEYVHNIQAACRKVSLRSTILGVLGRLNYESWKNLNDIQRILSSYHEIHISDIARFGL